MEQNKNFVLRHIYDKYILMPIRNNTSGNDPILLSDVAAQIWSTSAQATSKNDLLSMISTFYDLSPSSPEQASVLHFIEQMCAMGLISDSYKEN